MHKKRHAHKAALRNVRGVRAALGAPLLRPPHESDVCGLRGGCPLENGLWVGRSQATCLSCPSLSLSVPASQSQEEVARSPNAYLLPEALEHKAQGEVVGIRGDLGPLHTPYFLRF